MSRSPDSAKTLALVHPQGLMARYTEHPRMAALTTRIHHSHTSSLKQSGSGCTKQRSLSNAGITRLGVLNGIDAKFLYAREQSCAIEAQTCCCSRRSSYPPFALGQSLHDFLALFPCVLVGKGSSAIQSADGLLDNARNLFLSSHQTAL